MPRFCVFCGHPMAMLSPYSAPGDDEAGALLPLRTKNGDAPAVCPITGGLLKVCAVCGRLYTARESVCETIGCGAARLTEPMEAFPTATGHCDGTHAAGWRGAARLGNVPPANLQPTPPMTLQPGDAAPQALAFRYGRLVLANERGVGVWEYVPVPSAQPGALAWSRIRHVALPAGGGAIKGLLLDDGNAYLQTEKRTYIIGITLGQITQTTEEAGVLQARNSLNGSNLWARVVSESGSAVLRSQNRRTEQEAAPVALNVAASTVAALCLVPSPPGANDESHEAVLVATRNAGILWINPLVPNAAATALALPFIEWIQVAWRDDAGIALGRDAEAGVFRLLSFDRYGNTGSEAVIAIGDAQAGAPLGEFVWHGDTVYVVTEKRVLRFDARQLSTNPHALMLAAGSVNKPGMVALYEPDAPHVHRLLLRRVRGAAAQFMFVDTENGGEKPAGGVTVGEPFAVPVSGEAVVFCSATNNGANWQLQTYRLPAAVSSGEGTETR